MDVFVNEMLKSFANALAKSYLRDELTYFDIAPFYDGAGPDGTWVCPYTDQDTYLPGYW